MKKKKYFDNLDDFSRFFRNYNYWAYPSGDTTMLMSSSSTAPIVIMISPERVTIHRGEDQHFYSCQREDWGPDFLERCGRKENRYYDYERLARDYRSYQTLDSLGRFLVDECGMRLEGDRLKPKCCQLSQTVYDDKAYYTMVISLRENRNYFDLNFTTEPCRDKQVYEKKYSNMTDWGIGTLAHIGKELPIKILTDYVRKFKRYQKRETEKEYEDYEY